MRLSIEIYMTQTYNFIHSAGSGPLRNQHGATEQTLPLDGTHF